MNEPSPTPARLLGAATALFAERGYEGASVREIAKRAHANLGAVTYHFGSKRRLYLAVLDALMGELADRTTAIAATAGAARERLGRVIRGLFAFFAEHPEAPPLFIKEIAQGGPPPEPAVRHMRRHLDALTQVIRDGQSRGELRAVEPLLAAFTVMSQCVWFAIIRRHVAVVSAVPLDRPEQAQVMERHIADVVGRAFGLEEGSR